MTYQNDPEERMNIQSRIIIFLIKEISMLFEVEREKTNVIISEIGQVIRVNCGQSGQFDSICPVTHETCEWKISNEHRNYIAKILDKALGFT